MKNLIAILALIAALLIVGNANSQNHYLQPTRANDSISIAIQQKNTYDIYDIDLRMDRYSRQNVRGNGFIFWGVITSIIGTTIIYKNADIPYFKNYVILGLGGALTTTGYIINLNSHRKLRSYKYHKRF